MPSSRALLPKLALALSLAPSCAGPRPEGAALDLTQPQGIEAPAEDAGWRAGDSVLLRLDLEEPGQARTWFVRLTVPPGMPLSPSSLTYTLTLGDEERIVTSANIHVVAEVYDARGTLLDRSRSTVAERLLRTGYTAYSESVLAMPAQLTSAPQLTDATQLTDADFDVILGMISFPMLLTAVQENESLSELLWEVVERPSLLSMILSGGRVDLGLRPSEDGGVRRLESAPSGADFEVALELTLNRELALVLSFEVTESVPPLQLAAGVLSFEGTHPDEPGRILRGRVISASRGELPSWVAEGAGKYRMLEPGGE